MSGRSSVALEDFPEAVTLRFRNKAERDYFMGQLSDGWGENECTLDWDHRTAFRKCTSFNVTVFNESGCL